MSCVQEDLVGGPILFNIRPYTLERKCQEGGWASGHTSSFTKHQRTGVKSETPCEHSAFAQALVRIRVTKHDPGEKPHQCNAQPSVTYCS